METTGKDTSLIGCKMDVPDPRVPYNQRHKFIDIQEKSCRMGVASRRKKCNHDEDHFCKVLTGLNTGAE